jgi:adenylate kinase family enzyme
MRTLITGASGSGTTTLGRALADILKVPFFDADDYYWLPTDPPYQQKRTASLRLSMLTKDLDCARNGAIVAGSVVNWGMELEDSFSLIVFLLVPAEARVDRLRKRETALFGVVNPEFVAWAAQYDEGRLPGRSLAIHERWLSSRRCKVLRIEGDVSLDDSVNRIITNRRAD